jgi:hypothetical protein
MADATYIFHPLAMNSFRHWITLLRESGGIAPRHWPRAALITVASPLWGPLRWAERLRYGGRLDRMELRQAPLFVVGHWRTGTTHLHNLLSHDPQFGFVSTFQTLAPSSFLLGRHTLRPLVARSMPKTRPMDNMALSADLPQEEEFAMCNVTPHSFYVGWYFPRRIRELFDKYVIFRDADPDMVREWERHYLELLKKATLQCGGRRLVLKNPANTGRIPQLLHLFPDAKFLHIRRNPYAVYKSTVNLHRSTYATIGFQDVTTAEIEENVLHMHAALTRRYFETRDLIPPGNLVEIAYEDLEARPLAVLEEAYGRLGLPGWQEARPAVAAYLATQAAYEKNRFTMRARDIARVEEHLRFALDAWGYERPEVAAE